jgi:2-hydroxy-3-oxopropionate reductase
MTRIGFIGLGIMGGPMAANLVTAGHEVTVYDRVPGALHRRAAARGRGVTSIAGAVEGAEFIVTMLPDSPDVEAVALGDDGVLAHAKPGVRYADMSSIRPDTARRVAAAAADAGIRALDAPVSGGEKGAIEATLSIMVGGAAEDFAAARPVFDAVGRTVVHVGPPGSGQTVKAANQLIVAGTIQLVAEAIVLVEASGVDPAAAVQVLAGGLAGNRILDTKAAGMIAREFAPGFRIDLHHKDMGVVLAAAREAGVVIPMGALAAQLVAAVRARGGGGLDHTALLTLVEALSGRTGAGLKGRDA